MFFVNYVICNEIEKNQKAIEIQNLFEDKREIFFRFYFYLYTLK